MTPMFDNATNISKYIIKYTYKRIITVPETTP